MARSEERAQIYSGTITSENLGYLSGHRRTQIEIKERIRRNQLDCFDIVVDRCARERTTDDLRRERDVDDVARPVGVNRIVDEKYVANSHDESGLLENLTRERIRKSLSIVNTAAGQQVIRAPDRSMPDHNDIAVEQQQRCDSHAEPLRCPCSQSRPPLGRYRRGWRLRAVHNAQPAEPQAARSLRRAR